jgi:hypothetical protein
MSTPADRVAARFIEDVGFLSSTLRSEDTGVDGVVIWFFAGEFSRNESRHGPRVQVALGRKFTLDGLADSVAATMTSPPEVLGTLPTEVAARVVAFIDRNRGALLQHWRGEIDTRHAIERLERV